MAIYALLSGSDTRIRFVLVAMAALAILLGAEPAGARDFATYQLSFGEGPLWAVQELAVAQDGQSIVLSDNGQVRRYSLTGDLLDQLYSTTRVRVGWSHRLEYGFPEPLVSIVCGSDGAVFVGEYAWGTLLKFDPEGALIKTIGSTGADPGQFQGLTTLALAPDGSLYAGDFGNNRIQHFSADLDFINQWPLPPRESEFHPVGPDAIAIDSSGNIHVAWTAYPEMGSFAARIITYAPDGSLLAEYPVTPDPLDEYALGNGWLFRDIAFDPSGRLWVLLDSRPEERKLINYDESGNIVEVVTLPEASHHFSFASDGTILAASEGYVTSDHPQGRSWVTHLTASGQPMGDWGDAWWAVGEAANGRFVQPHSMAFDLQGNILIAGGLRDLDEAYNEIPLFSYLNRYLPDGAYDTSLFWETDPAETNFSVAVAPDGEIVRSSQPFGIDQAGNRYTLDISDYLHPTVTKTDANGALLAEWDLGGRGVVGICVGMDGFLYVQRIIGIGSVYNTSQLEKYDLNGNLLGYWQPVGNIGLAEVDPAGCVYLNDKSNDIGQVGVCSVKVYAPSSPPSEIAGEMPQGELLATITAAGNELFSNPPGVALSLDGKMALHDGPSNRVHLFQLNPPLFPDVPLWDWAIDGIEALAGAGIVSGFPDGTYQPALPVDRAQTAVYLARALAGGDVGVPTFLATPTFSDVPTDYWASKYVEYAVDQGVVGGYEDGTYHPEYPVDRGQMAVCVARALVAPSGEAGLADYVPSTPHNFPDVPSDLWAYKYVEYCVEHGVVNGYPDGYYYPANPVTRDQMAVFVQRAFGVE